MRGAASGAGSGASRPGADRSERSDGTRGAKGRPAGETMTGGRMERGPAPPGRARVLAAILALPFAATVVVPALILALGGEAPGPPFAGVPRIAAAVLGLALLVAGLTIFVATVRLFAAVGRGTLAPWDPPQRLVISGPYRYVRHPMIAGVTVVLAGEALLTGSAGIAVLLAAFVAVNALYLPLVEEPALVRRYGSDYERYRANVKRWLPRLRGWDPPSRSK
jgi:protein-S-isoprenylcysteine O-methyltransferase Ste14